MATSDLPLKIRVDIRDSWDSLKSPLQAAVSSLDTTLGHRVVPVVRWPILWDASKDRFSDKAIFIPTISRIVIAWYDRLLFRLENDDFAEWTEQFLTLLSQSGNSEKRLHIEPSPSQQVSFGRAKEHFTSAYQTQNLHPRQESQPPSIGISTISSLQLKMDGMMWRWNRLPGQFYIA